MGWVWLSPQGFQGQSPSLILEGLDRCPGCGTPGLGGGPCSAQVPALGLVSHVSWMGQSLYPDRSRRRLLQGSVWGQALARAGQLPSARGLHRHRASGVAGWELASCPVLGVAAAGSCPGLTGCSRLAPSVPSLDSGTPGTLELLFSSS